MKDKEGLRKLGAANTTLRQLDRKWRVLPVSSWRTAIVSLALLGSQEVQHARLTLQRPAVPVTLSWTMDTVLQMAIHGHKLRRQAVMTVSSSWTMVTVKKLPSLALICAALAAAVIDAETDRLVPKANLIMIAKK